MHGFVGIRGLLNFSKQSLDSAARVKLQQEQLDARGWIILNEM